jgi:hypothetical protein
MLVRSLFHRSVVTLAVLCLAGLTLAADLFGHAGSNAAATAQILQSRDRQRGANNLKQIGLAIHNYHDVHRHLPSDIRGKDGKALLSWRVAILPFLEADQLYREFKLDEAWDSEHNKKLLASMPKVYAPTGVDTKEMHATFYQGFVGKGTIFEEKAKISLANIQDGTSNTLMVTEAAEAVPWSKPADMTYDPQQPLPKLGCLFGGDFHILWCDGSVSYVRKGFDEATLRLTITRNDGKPVNTEKLR